MTYEQRYAALELGDQLRVFAEQYNLSEKWVQQMEEKARKDALKSTNIDINEA